MSLSSISITASFVLSKGLFGYSLTGSTAEQCLFLLHGAGANGKSTFVKTISNLLGDYAQTADFETFLIRSSDGGVRNDLARIKGKRFISAVEMESGRRLAELPKQW